LSGAGSLRLPGQAYEAPARAPAAAEAGDAAKREARRPFYKTQAKPAAAAGGPGASAGAPRKPGGRKGPGRP
jgi:hypothetical protein